MKIQGFCLSSPFGKGTVLGYPQGVKSIGFVEVRLSNGLVGIGETYAGVYSPELVAPVARTLGARLETLKPAEALKRLLSPNFIPFVSSSGLVRSVSSALEIALLDVIAQEKRVPLWKLLAKKSRPQVPLYASGGSGAMTAEAVANDVRIAIELGHTAFKMRVGFQSWQNDLKRVVAARQALGNKRFLMIDAIMGTISPTWTLETARKRIRELAKFSPVWVEEPLAPHELEAYSALCRDVSVPVAAGESWTSRAEFAGAIQTRAVDFIQPDATHCGGAIAAAEICRKAKTKKIRSALHVWGSPVAFLANMHVAAACSEVEYLEIPMVTFALAPAMGWETPRPVDGHLPPPARPGLGVGISEKVKKAFPFVPGSGYIWGVVAKVAK